MAGSYITAWLCAWLAEFDVCDEPVDAGRCREDHVKWYFDNGSGQCRQFRYGGCDGNANRFDSLDSCENICIIRRRKGRKINKQIGFVLTFLCNLSNVFVKYLPSNVENR